MAPPLSTDAARAFLRAVLVAGFIALSCSPAANRGPSGARPAGADAYVPGDGGDAPGRADLGTSGDRSNGAAESAGAGAGGSPVGAPLPDAGATDARAMAAGRDGASAAGGAPGTDGSGPSPVPGRSVTPFGYGELRQILASGGSGADGTGWCANQFGKTLGGTWACQSVSGGNLCAASVPDGELVSCVRAAVSARVDETPFAPPACDADRLDAAAKEFCMYTEYMRTRTQSTLYVYNDWVRAGFNRSFGGALTELYGADKRNRIEEHGGSAAQLSIWAYDAKGGPAAFFTTESCDPIGFSAAAACKAANSGKDCRLFGTGQHVVDCKKEKACLDWTAAGPWNPIQAQAADCGWNGPSNDVDSVISVADGLKLSKTNPYHFTKTGPMSGLLWSTTGKMWSDRPYLQVDYEMDYSGPFSLSTHNQEIPALFTDTRLGTYYYYFAGGAAYQNAAAPVERVAATDVANAQLRLPGRTGELPQPAPAKYLDATEEWLSSCDATESQCLTVVSFAPEVRILNLGGQYVTPMGRFAPSGHHAWTIYLFPYRYDDLVAGRTVRQWVYELRSSAR